MTLVFLPLVIHNNWFYDKKKFLTWNVVREESFEALLKFVQEHGNCFDQTEHCAISVTSSVREIQDLLLLTAWLKVIGIRKTLLYGPPVVWRDTLNVGLIGP